MLYAVIMAGGSGTRFWPLSRGHRPKQLLRIVGQGTMIQATVARLQPTIPVERVLVITTAALADETRRQLPMLKPEQVIAEPVGRDTAACAALAACIAQRLDAHATVAMLPADAVIGPADAFQAGLVAAEQAAADGSLVTFGVTARAPATGYGYICLGAECPAINGISVNQVQRFVEKPDLPTAERYLAEGCYRWNSGIFVWRAESVLKELSQHAAWLTEALMPLAPLYGTDRFDAALAEVYQPLKRISIDYALLEKAQRILALTPAFSWDDVGSWDSLYDHLPVDANGVIARGREVVTVDCADSLIICEDAPQLIAAIGLQGVSVVATSDAILICAKGHSQAVKQVIDQLKTRGRADLL